MAINDLVKFETPDDLLIFKVNSILIYDFFEKEIFKI